MTGAEQLHPKPLPVPVDYSGAVSKTISVLTKLYRNETLPLLQSTHHDKTSCLRLTVMAFYHDNVLFRFQNVTPKDSHKLLLYSIFFSNKTKQNKTIQNNKESGIGSFSVFKDSREQYCTIDMFTQYPNEMQGF